MAASAAHQALYRRWRAQRFAEVVGQDAIVTTLRNAVRLGRTGHAYLFVGPRGIGKTSLARIMAKAVNCPNVVDGEPCDACPSCVAIREGRTLDVVELDAASNNRVDDIRELLPRIYTGPADLPTKVFIIDEVQRITQGWDVLLKTLEEPPPHVLFIFCTTDSSQIRPAVVSRVQRFDFRRIPAPIIEGKLRRILEADGRVAEPAAVTLVAALADGGMRDAESMLDQLLSSGAERLTADDVRELLGLADGETVAAFVRALATGDVAGGLAVLDAVEQLGRDLGSFTGQAVDALRVALRGALTGAGDDPLAALGTGPLTDAGRRLAAMEPASSAPGGIRFQLELALLARVPAGATVALAAAPVPAAPPPVAPSPAVASPPAMPARPTTPPPRVPAGAAAPEAGPARPLAAVPAPQSAAPAAPVPSPREPVPASSSAAPAGGAVAVEPGPAAAEAVRSGPPERPAAPAPDGPLAEILGSWSDIVAVVSRHPPTKPLIEACRPIAVDGAIVTLGFPEHQQFLRDVADRRRATLEEGIARVLGRPVTVRCVATNLDLAPAPPANGEAAAVLAAAREVWGDELVDVPEVE